MTPIIIYPKPQYSTTMIFAVLDVSLIMGLNIGETDRLAGPSRCATTQPQRDGAARLSRRDVMQLM